MCAIITFEQNEDRIKQILVCYYDFDFSGSKLMNNKQKSSEAKRAQSAMTSNHKM